MKSIPFPSGSCRSVRQTSGSKVASAARPSARVPATCTRRPNSWRSCSSPFPVSASSSTTRTFIPALQPAAMSLERPPREPGPEVGARAATRPEQRLSRPGVRECDTDEEGSHAAARRDLDEPLAGTGPARRGEEDLPGRALDLVLESVHENPLRRPADSEQEASVLELRAERPCHTRYEGREVEEPGLSLVGPSDRRKAVEEQDRFVELLPAGLEAGVEFFRDVPVCAKHRAAGELEMKHRGGEGRREFVAQRTACAKRRSKPLLFEALTHGDSPSNSTPPEDRDDRPKQDEYVQKRRPMEEIAEVVAELDVRLRRVGSHHLRETRQTRFEDMPETVGGNLSLVGGHEFGALGPRSDEAHRPAQDVEKLRKLVEPRPP